MMGYKICFYGEMWIIIPKLSLLLLLIWSTGSHVRQLGHLHHAFFALWWSTLRGKNCPTSCKFFPLRVDYLLERRRSLGKQTGSPKSCSPFPFVKMAEKHRRLPIHLKPTAFRKPKIVCNFLSAIGLTGII